MDRRIDRYPPIRPSTAGASFVPCRQLRPDWSPRVAGAFAEHDLRLQLERGLAERITALLKISVCALVVPSSMAMIEELSFISLLYPIRAKMSSESIGEDVSPARAPL